MHAQNKILQWIALTGVVLSCGWLISHPDYEPAIALSSSLLVWLGLKYKQSLPKKPISSPSIDLSSATKSQLHLSALLRGAYISDRPSIIKDSMDVFTSITPVDVAEILGLLYIFDRPKALQLLTSRISPPPSSTEATRILDQLYISDRPFGAKLISQIHITGMNAANVDGATQPKIENP